MLRRPVVNPPRRLLNPKNMPLQALLTAAKVFAARRLVLEFDKIRLEHTGLSSRRIRNWLFTELSSRLRTKRPLALPTHLQIEPSSACNLACPMCHRVTHGLPSGLLDPGHFRAVIDEVGDCALLLHFWGWGEPFVNPDIYSMIRYAHDRGIKVVTSTNGHFLCEGGQVEQLLESGLDALIVALDGVDAATYAAYRRHGDYFRVLKGLRQLVKTKAATNSRYPLVNLRMVVRRDNEDQIGAMQSLAQELGVDLLTLKTFYMHDNEEDPAPYLPRDHAYRRFEYDSAEHPIRKENRCKRMWNHPVIYHDGSVSVCDYFTHRELCLGKAFGAGGTGFRDVWFGRAYEEQRRRFAKAATRTERCDRCALNYVTPDGYVSHAFRLTPEADA